MTDYEIMQSERLRGKGVKFERIRRITGYLVGTLDRFNSGKLAEVNQRTKNDVSDLSRFRAMTDEVVTSQSIENKVIA